MIPQSDQHIRRKLTDIEERVNAQDFKKAFKLINGFVQKSKDITETCIFLAMKCSILINYNSPLQLKDCKDELKKRIVQDLTHFSPLLFETMHNVWYQMRESHQFLKIVEVIYNKNQKDSKCASFIMDLYFEKMDFLAMNKIVKAMENAFPDPKYKVFSAFLMYMNAMHHSPHAIGLAKLSIASIFLKYQATKDFNPPIGEIQLYSKILSKSGDPKAAINLLHKYATHLESKEANYAQKLQLSVFLNHNLLAQAYNACVRILSSNFYDKVQTDFELIFKYIELTFSLLLKVFEVQKNITKFITGTVAEFVGTEEESKASDGFMELSAEETEWDFSQTYKNILGELRKFSKHTPQKGSLTYKQNIRKSAGLGYIYGIHRLLIASFQSGKASDKTQLCPLFQPLSEYILQNFDTPSLLIDVQPYFHYLEQQEREKLLQSLRDTVSSEKQEMETKVAQKAQESKQNTFSVEIKYLRMYTNLKRIEKILGVWHTLSPLELTEILNLYTESLSYQGVVKKGEHRVGDQLILLVMESLSSATTVIDGNTLAAILSALGAMKHTPHNYFIKVQLLRILGQFGFHDLFSEIFLKLEVKAVLHESLGYLGQIPFFLNLEYDRFGVGLQKLRKYHLKSGADLRVIKNQSLDERNFGAIEHFIDFETFSRKSYFYLLCTLIQKCCTFQKAMQKHTKKERISNLEQVDNFTTQGAQEMTQFFKENQNQIFTNRTQDLNLILPKNQFSTPVAQLISPNVAHFLDNADQGFKIVISDDILLQHYKTHPKTNYRPGKVNVLNIFESPETLKSLLKIFTLVHSATEESKQSEIQFDAIYKEIEDLQAIIEQKSKDVENRSVSAEFKWFSAFSQFCLACCKYIQYLEQLTSLKLGMMNPDLVAEKIEPQKEAFKTRSEHLDKMLTVYLESTSLPDPPTTSRKQFITQVEQFKWESDEAPELLKSVMSLTPPLLRRTNLFITMGLTYLQFLVSRIFKLSFSVVGKRKKVKNKTDAHLAKDSQLKELETLLKEFKMNLLSRVVGFLKHTIQDCLSQDYLNRLSDVYVEYIRALIAKHGQTQAAQKFIQLSCSKGQNEDIDRECHELARGYVHSWKRAKTGLETNLSSIEAKLGE